jgi:hypothetical protein
MTCPTLLRTVPEKANNRKDRRLAHRASLVCLAGSTVQIIYGVLAVPFGPYTEITGTWDEMLWALASGRRSVGFDGGFRPASSRSPPAL